MLLNYIRSFFSIIFKYYENIVENNRLKELQRIENNRLKELQRIENNRLKELQRIEDKRLEKMRFNQLYLEGRLDTLYKYELVDFCNFFNIVVKNKDNKNVIITKIKNYFNQNGIVVYKKEKGDFSCPICLDDDIFLYINSCGHGFCILCCKKMSKCPLCKKKMVNCIKLYVS